VIKYLKRIALGFDMMVNAILGGYAGETISFRMAVNAAMGKPLGCLFCRVIEWFVPEHCDLEQPSKEDRLSRGWVSERQWFINNNIDKGFD